MRTLAPVSSARRSNRSLASSGMQPRLLLVAGVDICSLSPSGIGVSIPLGLGAFIFGLGTRQDAGVAVVGFGVEEVAGAAVGVRQVLLAPQGVDGGEVVLEAGLVVAALAGDAGVFVATAGFEGHVPGLPTVEVPLPDEFDEGLVEFGEVGFFDGDAVALPAEHHLEH